MYYVKFDESLQQQSWSQTNFFTDDGWYLAPVGFDPASHICKLENGAAVLMSASEKTAFIAARAAAHLSVKNKVALKIYKNIGRVTDSDVLAQDFGLIGLVRQPAHFNQGCKVYKTYTSDIDGVDIVVKKRFSEERSLTTGLIKYLYIDWEVFDVNNTVALSKREIVHMTFGEASRYEKARRDRVIEQMIAEAQLAPPTISQVLIALHSLYTNYPTSFNEGVPVTFKNYVEDYRNYGDVEGTAWIAQVISDKDNTALGSIYTALNYPLTTQGEGTTAYLWEKFIGEIYISTNSPIAI